MHPALAGNPVYTLLSIVLQTIPSLPPPPLLPSLPRVAGFGDQRRPCFMFINRGQHPWGAIASQPPQRILCCSSLRAAAARVITVSAVHFCVHGRPAYDPESVATPFTWLGSLFLGRPDPCPGVGEEGGAGSWWLSLVATRRLEA